MPEIIASKIQELDLHELIRLLRSIQMEDSEAFAIIKEKLDDII